MEYLTRSIFHWIVKRYGGDHRVRRLPWIERFRVMVFAHLNYPENMRDIETCLSAQSTKLYHMGFRQAIRHATLAVFISPTANCTKSTCSVLPEAGAFYVMDRAYVDFPRLYRLDQTGSFFVIRDLPVIDPFP